MSSVRTWDAVTHETKSAGPRTASHDLEALFRPRGVLVVGASTDPLKLGGAMAASLTTYGGHLALVNARGVNGMSATVAEAAAAAGHPLDLAVLCVPASACAGVVHDCAEAGIGAVLICAGGFSESGGDGSQHEARLMAAAAESAVRVLGPNTSGFFVPSAGLFASFVPGAVSLRPGNVGIVAASGGLSHALAFAFARRGVGLSLAVGIGAGLDVAAPEVLEFLADDTATTAIALHVESVTDGPGLLRAVRRASRAKPVIALVVGRHDIGDFARSHTGALATSWRTTRALLAQAGAVLVEDEEALVTATSVLARTRPGSSKAPAAALITAQAGPGLLVADALHEAGVPLPTLAADTQQALSEVLPPLTYQANPVDTGRPGPHHDVVISSVANDAAIDLLGIYALAEPVVDLVDSVTRAAVGDRVSLVIGVDGPAEDVENARRAAEAASIPFVVGPSALACALDAFAQDSRHQEALACEPKPADLAESDDPICGPLSEAEAKDLLDGLDIATPVRELCSSAEEALAALARIGGPVAVKISSTAVLHKSDIGGVRLGVSTAAEMADAYRIVSAVSPDAHPQVLVERMADPGVDLIVGARRDPVFGPVVVLGVGGVATEVYADVAIAAVPTSRERLRTLPRQLDGRALLEGFRGAPSVDLDELAQLVENLGAFLIAHPEVVELEINPLRATAGGLVALDAVVIAGPTAQHAREDIA